MAVLEVQTVRLFLISSYRVDISDVVVSGKMHCLRLSIGALVEKIEYLIKYSELCSKIDSQGYRFVEEKCDIKKLNQKSVEICQDLIEEKYE